MNHIIKSGVLLMTVSVVVLFSLAAMADGQFRVPAPSTPQVTSARPVSPSQVVLHWTPTTNTTSYSIFPYTSNSCLVPTTLNGSVTQHVLTGLPVGTHLTFVIHAVGPGGISRSSPVTVTTPSPPPEDIVTPKGATVYAVIHGVDLNRWRQAADGTTFCNYALTSMTAALGTPVPQGLAMAQIDWLANPANGWIAVGSGRQAQSLANQGYTVVAGYRHPGASHVAVVTPWNGTFSDSVGPRVSQAGLRTGYDLHSSVTFGQDFGQIRYFAHPR